MENASTPAATPVSVGIRYGILTGLAMIIVSVLLNVTEQEQGPGKWLTTVILIGGIFLAHKYYKQVHNGYLNYGQGVGIGAILSGVAAILNAISSYIYINFVDPGMAERILNKAQADMEARGGMSDADIERAIAWTAKFVNGPLMMVSVIFVIVLMGVLAALVISAFTKNARPEFE